MGMRENEVGEHREREREGKELRREKAWMNGDKVEAQKDREEECGKAMKRGRGRGREKLKDWEEIQGVFIAQMVPNKPIGHLTCVVFIFPLGR